MSLRLVEARIRSASRYFVTVRRAMWMSDSFSISAIFWSDRGMRESSALMIRAIFSLTLSEAIRKLADDIDDAAGFAEENRMREILSG